MCGFWCDVVCPGECGPARPLGAGGREWRGAAARVIERGPPRMPLLVPSSRHALRALASCQISATSHGDVPHANHVDTSGNPMLS